MSAMQYGRSHVRALASNEVFLAALQKALAPS